MPCTPLAQFEHLQHHVGTTGLRKLVFLGCMWPPLPLWVHIPRVHLSHFTVHCGDRGWACQVTHTLAAGGDVTGLGDLEG